MVMRRPLSSKANYFDGIDRLFLAICFMNFFSPFSAQGNNLMATWWREVPNSQWIAQRKTVVYSPYNRLRKMLWFFLAAVVCIRDFPLFIFSFLQDFFVLLQKVLIRNKPILRRDLSFRAFCFRIKINLLGSCGAFTFVLLESSDFPALRGFFKIRTRYCEGISISISSSIHFDQTL